MSGRDNEQWKAACIAAPGRDREERARLERAIGDWVQKHAPHLLGVHGPTQPPSPVTVIVVPAAAPTDNAVDILGRMRGAFGGLGLQADLSDAGQGFPGSNGNGRGRR